MKKQDAYTKNIPLEHDNTCKPSLSNRLNNILRWCIPHHCVLCKATAKDYLCTPCINDLPWLTSHTCAQCSLPLIQNLSVKTPSDDIHLCGECLTKPPSFDKIICAFSYEFPLNDMIHRFKDQTDVAMGKFLTTQLLSKVKHTYQNDSLPQRIMPVPMHWKKLLQRGFNQADITSQHVNKALKIQVIHPVKKYASTANQHQLNKHQRQHNLQNSFALTKKSHLALAGIEHIALIDDVITTGATANALAGILKTVGVKKVDVWALARTPSPTIT